MGWETIEVKGRGIGPLAGLLGQLAGMTSGKAPAMAFLTTLTAAEAEHKQKLDAEKKAIMDLMEEQAATIAKRVQGYEARRTLFDHDVAARLRLPDDVEPSYRDNVNGVYVPVTAVERYGIPTQPGPAWDEKPRRGELWPDKPE